MMHFHQKRRKKQRKKQQKKTEKYIKTVADLNGKEIALFGFCMQPCRVGRGRNENRGRNGAECGVE